MPADNDGFRIHREPSKPIPLVDDGVEEEAKPVKKRQDWDEAIVILGFFALIGWVFWLFLR